MLPLSGGTVAQASGGTPPCCPVGGEWAGWRVRMRARVRGRGPASGSGERELCGPKERKERRAPRRRPSLPRPTRRRVSLRVRRAAGPACARAEPRLLAPLAETRQDDACVSAGFALSFSWSPALALALARLRPRTATRPARPAAARPQAKATHPQAKAGLSAARTLVTRQRSIVSRSSARRIHQWNARLSVHPARRPRHAGA
jgi:hypothetical protein